LHGIFVRGRLVHGIKVTFEGRTVRDLPVIFVCFRYSSRRLSIRFTLPW
jgi:hypothetical protein